jgi:hypothetical protein
MPEQNDVITTEAEANALPWGTIIRDNMGSARKKVSDRGWECSGVSGQWGPTWVAFPATVLYVGPTHEAHVENGDGPTADLRGAIERALYVLADETFDYGVSEAERILRAALADTERSR